MHMQVNKYRLNPINEFQHLKYKLVIVITPIL
jgi:hypothetical protein